MDLNRFLETWAETSSSRADVAGIIAAMARASIAVDESLGRALDLVGSQQEGDGSDTSAMQAVKGVARTEFRQHLDSTAAAAIWFGALAGPEVLGRDRRLLATVDVINGRRHTDTNQTLGTIFSIYPRPPADIDVSEPAAIMQSGEQQLAAGFIAYGRTTQLVVTLREGTYVFSLDRELKRYGASGAARSIPPMAKDYAINASNYRHWDEAIRTYVDDCLKGAEGVRAFDFNMRWVGSLVGEIFAILLRGGIYLYPADRRAGYAQGLHNLIMEANPIALLVENAGGASSTGRARILEIKPRSLDERSPVVVGSRAEVNYVCSLYNQPHALGERSPLFGNRGLFRI
ncbi:MAG: class 1 fructose-bisphosphatase [Pseudomonadota bacterium]